jgi:D-amino-acid dehydrogenase
MGSGLRRGEDPVLVVGGGIVGLSTAYYLLRAGLAVEVVERSVVASGASLGNAGWVCLSHSAPVAAPGVLGYAVRSLGRPDSPLYVRPFGDAGLLPWLLRFWRNSTPSRFERGYAAVADLNRATFDLFDELRESGVDTGLTRPGMVHAFLSAAHARQHLRVQRLMAHGRYEVPDDIVVTAGDLDASIAPTVQAAYLVPGEGVVDPGRLVRSLRDRVQDAGGKVHENVEVSGFHRSGDTVVGVHTTQGDMACGAVVVAAGMWSAKLLGHLGHRLALQAGKGYSFSIDLDPAPRHALYFGDHKLVASPIAGATRIAGTMELSGNNNRLDWRRVVALAKASRHYLGDWFTHPDELPGLIRDPWVGGRPLLPDSLPVIDRLPGCANAFVNTGHGMLGVTLGPASGQAITDYVRTGRRPESLTPFRFDRLHR